MYMLDRFVAHVVAPYLDKYIKDLNREHVTVSILSGNVVLSDLELRRNALRELKLPVCVKHGVIRKLTVYIPWARMRTDRLRVEIDGIDITVHPKRAATYAPGEEEEEAHQEKMEELAMYEELWRQYSEQQKGGSSGGENDDDDEAAAMMDGAELPDDADDAEDGSPNNAGFMARWKAAMLNNLHVDVRDVTITYEDVVTNPSRPANGVLKFDRLTAETTNAEWEPNFAKAADEILYKLARLTGVRVTVGSGSEETTSVCSPLDLAVRAKHQPLSVDPDAPRWSVDVDVTDLTFSVDRRQWDAIWQSVRFIQHHEELEAFRRLRPHVPIRANPRAWWHFAYAAVRVAIERRNPKVRFDWHKFWEHKKLETEYQDLHKRRQGAEWLAPLSDEEEAQAQLLERQLPIGSLIKARLLAVKRLELESQSPAAQRATERARIAKQRGGWRSWWAWTTGQRNAAGEALTEEEDDQLWNLIDAEEWSTEQRRLIEEMLEYGPMSGGGGSQASPASPAARPSSPPPGAVPPLAQHSSASALAPKRTPSRVLRATNAVHVDAAVSNISLYMLDFDRNPFVRVELSKARGSYSSTETTWGYGLTCGMYSILGDTRSLAETIGSSSSDPQAASSTSDEHFSEIVCVSKDHAALTQKVADKPNFAAKYRKLDPTQSDGIEYSCSVEVQPISVEVSVPWLQRVIDFWGVDTSLTPVNTRTGEARKSTRVAESEPETAAAREVQHVAALVVWHEKNHPTEWLILVMGLSVRVPDGASRCTHVTVPTLTIANDVEEDVRKKRKFVGQQAGSIELVETDWRRVFLVSLSQLRIDAAWSVPSATPNGEKESHFVPVLYPIDIGIEMQTLLVKDKLDVPLKAINFSVGQDVSVYCDLGGLSVVLSSTSLVLDFLNDSSGRKAYMAAAEGTDLVTSDDMFGIDVAAPFCAYYLGSTKLPVRVSEQRHQWTDMPAGTDPLDAFDYRCVAFRYQAVSVYHRERPTMPAVQFTLKPDTYRYSIAPAPAAARKGADDHIVTLYILQGGVPHEVRRERLDDARAVLRAHGVEPVDSIPQLQVLVTAKCALLRRPDAVTQLRLPEADATISELWAAFSVIEEAADTCPCRCVTFRVSSHADAMKLIRAAQRAANEPRPEVAVPDVDPDEARRCLIDVTASIPSVNLTVLSKPQPSRLMPFATPSTRVQPLLDIKLIGDVELRHSVTLFDSCLSVQAAGFTWGSGNDGRLLVCEPNAFTPMPPPPLPQPAPTTTSSGGSSPTSAARTPRRRPSAVGRDGASPAGAATAAAQALITSIAASPDRQRAASIRLLRPAAAAAAATSSGGVTASSPGGDGADAMDIPVSRLRRAMSMVGRATMPSAVTPTAATTTGSSDAVDGLQRAVTFSDVAEFVHADDEDEPSPSAAAASSPRHQASPPPPCFLLTFTAGAGSPPTLGIRADAPVSVTMTTATAVSIETLMDVINIFKMKHLANHVVPALPFNSVVQFQELPEYFALEAVLTAPVRIIGYNDAETVRNRTAELNLDDPALRHRTASSNGGNLTPQQEAALRSMLPSVVMQLDADAISVRWTISESTNNTSVKAVNTTLVLFPQLPELRSVFVQPDPVKLENDPDSPMTFDLGFKVTYAPHGMSNHRWITSRGPSGFHFTNFFSIDIDGGVAVYRNTHLWTLIEYFTNGNMTRLAWMGARRYILAGVQTPQPFPPVEPFPPPAVFWHILVHQSFRIRNATVLAAVDHGAPILFLGRCPEVAIYSDLVPATNEHGGTDLRLGLRMDFNGMRMYSYRDAHTGAIQPCNVRDLDVSGMGGPDRPELVAEFDLSCNVWHSMAPLHHSRAMQTLEVLLPRMTVEATTQQFADIWAFLCGCFMEPWLNVHPVKKWAENPYTNLMERLELHHAGEMELQREVVEAAGQASDEMFMLPDEDDVADDHAANAGNGGLGCLDPTEPPSEEQLARPLTLRQLRGRSWALKTHCYDIRAARFTFHILDDDLEESQELFLLRSGKEPPKASESAWLCGSDLVIWLQWCADGAFDSYYAASSMAAVDPSVIHPMPSALHESDDDDPSAAAPLTATRSRGYSGIHGERAASEAKSMRKGRFLHVMAPLQVRYGWTAGSEHEPRVVKGDYMINGIELVIAPRSWAAFRDTFLSLRVRNAAAPMFRWPQYTAGQDPTPWDPKTQQDYAVCHRLRAMLVCVILVDDTMPDNGKRKPGAGSAPVSTQSFRGRRVRFTDPSAALPDENAGATAASSVTAQPLRRHDLGSPLVALNLCVLSVDSQTTPFVESSYMSISLETLSGNVISPPPLPPSSRNRAAGGRMHRTRSVLEEVCSEHTVPLIVPRHEGGNILHLVKSSDEGFSGEVHGFWVIAPVAGKIAQIRSAVQSPSFELVGGLGSFREDRILQAAAAHEKAVASSAVGLRQQQQQQQRSRAASVASSAAATASNVYPEDDGTGGYATSVSKLATLREDVDAEPRTLLDVTIHHPCLVITEHEDMARGAIIDLGVVRINATAHKALAEAEPSTHQVRLTSKPTELELETCTTLRCLMRDLHIISLHDQTHRLLLPVDISADLSTSPSHTTGELTVGAVIVDCAQEYYESLLRSAARHLVPDEQQLVEQQQTANRSRSATQIDATTPSNVSFLSQATDGDALVGSPGGAAGSSSGLLSASSALGSSSAAAGGVAAVQAVRTETRVRIKVVTQSVTLRVHSDEICVELFVDDVGAQYKALGPASDLHATVAQLSLGVVGQDDLLQVGAQEDPIKIDVAWDGNKHSTVTTGNLQLCTLYLHENVLTPAISFLYEPYRRIVLPSYGVSETITIDDDTIIHQTLVLSSRKRIHVCNTKFNHIELDLCGRDLHLLPSASALIIVDPAVTLQVFNCTMYLYQQAFEQCVSTGNGGCIYFDESVEVRNVRAESSGLFLTADESSYRSSLDLKFAIDISLPDINDTRALNLRAESHFVQHTDAVEGDVRTEMTFELESLEAMCLYFNDKNSDDPTDYSSLIAPWGMVVKTVTEAEGTNSKTQINLASEKGVDVRLRVGDAILVIEVLKQLSNAFGQVKDTLPGPAVGAKVDELSVDQNLLEAEAEAGAVSTTTVAMNMKQLGFYLVDDSGSNLDQPLLYLTLFNIAAPTLEMTQRTSAVHVALHVQLEFYDLESGGWRPIVEKVKVDVVLKEVKALTLHDLANRTGQHRVGLRIYPLHVHITPVLVQVVMRAMELSTIISDKAKGKQTEAVAIATAVAASPASNATAPIAQQLRRRRYSRRAPAHSSPFAHAKPEEEGAAAAASATFSTMRFASPTKNRRNRRGDAAAADGDSAATAAALTGQTTSPLTVTTTTQPETATLAKASTMSRLVASGGSTSSPLGVATAKGHFAQYTITQHLGFDLTISFAESDTAKFPDPFVLPSGGSAAFNFPRIEGKELSVTQHRIIVGCDEGSVPLFVGQVGSTLATLIPPRNAPSSHSQFRFVVDVSLRKGQKRVVLRSNVTFTNHLPFAVDLDGVGEIRPDGEAVSVPAVAMRTRCTIRPVTNVECDPVQFGLQYVGLAFLYDQTFICTAKLRTPVEGAAGAAAATKSTPGLPSNDNSAGRRGKKSSPTIARKSLQEAVYFVAKFQKETRPLSAADHITDVRCTFDSPFSIANHTGAKITVALYLHRTMHARKAAGVLSVPTGVSFMHVATLPMEEGEMLPITQVDPLADVFMDLVVEQPTGEILTRTTGDPVLIRSQFHNARSKSVVIRDQYSQPLVIRIEYEYQRIVLTCGYWIVNQTMHYLQVAEPRLLQATHRTAGQTPEGIMPTATLPFLMCTPHQLDDAEKSKAQAVLRIGRHRPDGAVDWTDWSEPFIIDRVRETNVDCKISSSTAVTVALNISYVGGDLKTTMVLTFLPRWIIMNRCGRDLVLLSNAKDSQAGQPRLTAGQSRTVDVALRRGANMVRLQYATQDAARPAAVGESSRSTPPPPGGDDAADDAEAELEGIYKCEQSDPICIDRLVETGFNMRYSVHRDPGRVLFDVVRLSVYRKNGVYFIAVDPVERPPQIVENRTRYTCYVKQVGSNRELNVYPRSSKGFFLESESLPHKISLTVTDETSTSSAKCVVNLDPSILASTQNAARLMKQEFTMPVKNETLYVRVRSWHGSFAISVTHDRTIDTMLHQPFHQRAFRLHIERLFVLLSEQNRDIALFTVNSVDGTVSQGRSSETGSDMQLVDVRVGHVQLDDERRGSRQKYVMYTVPRETHNFVLLRQMDRANPIVQIRRLELMIRPLWLHLEDSFLFDVLRFVDRVRAISGDGDDAGDATEPSNNSLASLGGMQKRKVRSVATGAVAKYGRENWSQEVHRSTDEASLAWRLAMIDALVIDHVIVSVSLYRGTDTKRDPLRDRIGFLSSFIGSVNDARFDWRRVSEKNLCNKLWILADYLQQDYMQQLQRQVLNLVHVAGLDSMRTIVNDLLDGYMGPRTVHADKVAARLEPMRMKATFTHRVVEEEDEFVDVMNDLEDHDARQIATSQGGTIIALTKRGEDLTHVKPFSGNFGAIAVGGATLFSTHQCRCRDIEREKRRGRLSKMSGLRIEELAHHTTWDQFTAFLPPVEVRRYGPLALQQHIRTKAFTSDDAAVERPPVMCSRCDEIEEMRRERVANRQTCALPPPASRLVTWAEYCHHATWQDFAYLASDEELIAYCNQLRDGLMGVAQGVRRVDKQTEWAIDEDDEEDEGAAAVADAADGGGGAAPAATSSRHL